MPQRMEKAPCAVRDSRRKSVPATFKETRSPQNTNQKPNGPGGCDRGDGQSEPSRGLRAGAVRALSASAVTIAMIVAADSTAD